jgi:hypothetical protein
MNKLWTDNPRGGVDYAAVRRHTLPKALRRAGQQRDSVSGCRYLIAPCHLPVHWVLVVADLLDRTIMYLDPLGQPMAVSGGFGRKQCWQCSFEICAWRHV